MQTQLYKEDWIGLKALTEAGRVKMLSVAGGHLGISREDMKKHIVPYLEDKKGNVAKSPWSSLFLSLSHLRVSYADTIYGSPLTGY